MLVCPECFGVAGLKRRITEIRPTFPNSKCDYHPALKGIPLEEISKIVDQVIRDNYFSWLPDDHDNRAGNDLTDLLYEITGAEEHKIIESIITNLIDNDNYWPPDGEDAFYSEEYIYGEDMHSLGQHSRLWARFRERLLYGQRFFNPDAKRLLSEIFESVHQQRDNRGQGPVYLIQPGQPQARFFRARIADTGPLQKEIHSDLARNLGPPPERLRKAGRLNPSGISAFYAAFDLDTCIAELRPSVGTTVASAQFEITEAICVLDMTKFDAKAKEADVYTQGARQRAAQWQFMRSFMNEIAQPISPGDEHIDYISTQAVAEYLVHLHSFTFSGRQRTIDAVIYRSAQNPLGKNIAILGAAAVVGTPAVAQERHDKSNDNDPFGWLPEFLPAQRPRIIPIIDSFVLHKIKGAQFNQTQIPFIQEETMEIDYE